jgi:hypothetical protein
MSDCEHCDNPQCDLSDEEKGVLDALSSLCRVLAGMRNDETVIRMLVSLAIQAARRTGIEPDNFVDLVREEMLSATASRDNPDSN